MADAAGWSAIGDRVRRARLAADLSQADLGGAVGLDRTMIAKIESGSRRLDALELTRLAAALDVAIDDLLNAPPAVLSRRSPPAEDLDTDVARNAHRLEAALAAWLRDVRQMSETDLLRPPNPVQYSKPVTSTEDAKAAALWLRQRLGYGLEPLTTVMELCEKAGQFLLVIDLPGQGASVVDGDVAVAVVSRRLDPGRRRSTAAHELGHLVIGDEYSTDLGVSASRNERESVVDAFASELLLPRDALARFAGTPDEPVRERLIRTAASYRTSWSLVVNQAISAKCVDPADRQRLLRNNPTHVEFMDAVGWAPQPDLDSVRVPPSYAHAVVGSWRRGLITRTRAVELMHGQIKDSDLPVLDDTDVFP